MGNLQVERALFEQCLALADAERAPWLAEHCADPDLRERVIRLLRSHSAADASDLLRSPALPPPDRDIGPYRLLERIGEGAMGEVFLAQQSVPVLRRVALKVIKPGMDSRDVIARFESERQTLALMSHPSIVHIVEAGTTQSGRPYFAMEYVPGIALTRYCDQHCLPVDRRLALFLQICEAIQHAHQKGVIHRDLKPGNLLVTEIDGKAVAKVIDFGIAKAVAAVQAPGRAHTLLGNLVGTPEYMSPEQAQLSPLDVDTRSDVYSLGVVLHELLTGTLPFELSQANATPAMVAQELMTHDPAAPSARVGDKRSTMKEGDARLRGLTPRQLAARLAGDLDWIVLKALEKDRNRRYGSPSEFAADIRRHLANEAVLAGPPSTLYRMKKFAARHRVGLGMAAGVFMAIVAFAVLMGRQAGELAAQRDEARFQAQRAEASSEFMSLMLEEVGPAGKPLSPLELLDKGVELLNRQYGGDPRFTARMYTQMSRRFMDLGSTGKQREILQRAEAIARDLRDDELLADIECTIVQSEAMAGNNAEAAQRIESALGRLRRVTAPPASTRVNCLRAQAEVALGTRDFATAAAELKQARELLEASGDLKGLAYHAVLTDLGGIYFRTARYREALELNTLTGDALDRNGRGGTLARATVMANRASNLYRLGEAKQAQLVVQEAMRRLQLLRGDQPPTPTMAVQYGNTLNRLEQPEEAERLLRAARDQARALGNQSWATLSTAFLGRTYLISGKLTEAQRCLEEAHRSWQTDPTANRDRLAELSRTLAELALARGEMQEALRWTSLSLEQFGYPGNERVPGLAAGLSSASRIHLRYGDSEVAEKLATDALRVAESIARDPRQSADVGEALLVLAAARSTRDPHQDVSPLAARAVESLSTVSAPIIASRAKRSVCKAVAAPVFEDKRASAWWAFASQFHVDRVCLST